MYLPSVPVFTPDRRYIVVRGRLWRAANPDLNADERDMFTKELMSARRAVAAGKRKSDDAAVRRARRRVQRSKAGLGERGPVWWDDGAPDLNRRMIVNTPYAEWWRRIQRYRAAILELLGERDEDKSICPSDVARREAKQWRTTMDDVRTAARLLAEERLIRVTQNDRELTAGEEWRGAIRFRRARRR